MPPNRFAQRRLSAQSDRFGEVFDFENTFLGVPHDPEHNRIDVHGNRVPGKSRFRGNVCYTDSLIHETAEGVDYRNDVEEPRSSQSLIPAKPQHRDFLPLIRHFQREQQVQTDQETEHHRHGILKKDRNSETHNDGGKRTQSADAAHDLHRPLDEVGRPVLE